MVSVFYESQHDVVAGKARRQFDRVLPRQVGVLHSLENPYRTAGLDHAVEQKVFASILDETGGDEIGHIGILRRPGPVACSFDLALELRIEPFTSQYLC